MKKRGEKEDKPFDNRLLPTVLRFNSDLDAQLTSKANFIFGASTLVVVFVMNKVITPEFMLYSGIIRLAWFVLMIGSLAASLLSLMVVLPKLRIFSKKERVMSDIFYYKNILKYYTRDSYCDYLEGLPTNDKKSSLAYANQIYSLATTILPYKFKMLKISGWILLFSVISSIVLLMIAYSRYVIP